MNCRLPFLILEDFFSKEEHSHLMLSMMNYNSKQRKNLTHINSDLYNDVAFINKLSKQTNLNLRKVKNSDPNKSWLLNYLPKYKTAFVDAQKPHRDLKRYSGIQIRILIPLIESKLAVHKLHYFNETNQKWESAIYKNKNLYIVEAGKLLHFCENDRYYEKTMLVMDYVTDTSQNIFHKAANLLLNKIHLFKEKTLNFGELL